jgi:hypothetical protein
MSFRSLYFMLIYTSFTPFAWSNYLLIPSCIPLGSNVTIDFFIDRPDPMDFIAIFPTDIVDKSNQSHSIEESVKDWVPSPLHRNWIRTCGSQTCHPSSLEETISQGIIQIDFTNLNGSKQWIAVAGRYEHDKDQSFTILATSQMFSLCLPTVRCKSGRVFFNDYTFFFSLTHYYRIAFSSLRLSVNWQ